jgi:hypothetical protein
MENEEKKRVPSHRYSKASATIISKSPNPQTPRSEAQHPRELQNLKQAMISSTWGGKAGSVASVPRICQPKRDITT